MARKLIWHLSLFAFLIVCHAVGSIVGVVFAYGLWESVGDGPAAMVVWLFFFPRLLLYRMGVQFYLKGDEAIADGLIKPQTLVANSFASVACLYAVWFAWRCTRRLLIANHSAR